ncbi:MAG TPA: metal ABC transporter permease [Ilumatobacteraceae bacterium]|jgi:zinc/manganese transport system permease protein
MSAVGHMLSHEFIRHALIAGTSVAILSGLVGYFVVLRGQVFAGDALSHVAYTGALAALAAGIDLRVGLFVATIGVSVALGVLATTNDGADDVVIGTTFAWILGLGVLFLAIYTNHGSGTDSTANIHVLFGSIFGIDGHTATTVAIVAAGLVAVLALIARPLLFASIDPAVAAARGLPVRLIGITFLALVGATAAEVTQIIGALLLVGLLAVPAAAAQLLTNRPWRGLCLSAVLAIVAVWGGIVLAYAAPRLPPSFTIMAVAIAQYALAGAWAALSLRHDVNEEARVRRSAEPGLRC